MANRQLKLNLARF